MPAAPAVSIVVAAYNHRAFVGAMVRSALRQTFADWELLIVDDGSTDGTAAAARRAAGSDPRIQIFEQPNAGVVAARNRGLAMARGEFVAIVDSDDILPRRRTELMVAALRANPDAPFVYGDAWVVDARGRRLGRVFQNYPPVREGPFADQLFSRYCFVPACSVMSRRAALEASGPLWGPGPNCDYLKWIELGLQGDPVLLADEKLGCWRWHGANASRPRGARERVRQYTNLRRGLQEFVRRHPAIAPGQHARRFARCHFIAGFYAGRAGAWGLARRQFELAAKIDPSLVHALAVASTNPLLRPAAAACYAMAERLLLKVRR